MRTKDTAVRVKAGPDSGLAEGTFTAYASVFGNIDSYGERVVKGAFEGDLKAWEDSGLPIPLLFGHNMSDPDFNIGHVAKAVEDDHGLLVEGVLDLENPKAAQVYRMLKGGRVNQLSFAFDVLDSRTVSDDAGEKGRKAPEVRELTELKLYEVSIVTIGANQETEVLAVKSSAQALLAKAGRMLSAKNEASLRSASVQLRAAADEIEGVLSQLGAGDEKSGQPAGVDQVETSGTPQGAPLVNEEAGGAGNSDAGQGEPKASPSVSPLAAQLLIAQLG